MNMPFTRSWIRTIVLCVCVTCVSRTAIAETALDRFTAAYARPSPVFVRFETIGLGVSEEAEKALRSQPGWWRSDATVVEPESGRSCPIAARGTLQLDANLRVRRENFSLLGPPDMADKQSVELRSRTDWIHPFIRGSAEAELDQYPAVSLIEESKLRALGRTPHSLIWATFAPPCLAAYAVERLRAASDVIETRANDQTAISSRQADLTAWVGPDGELRGIELPDNVPGTRVRHEHSGIAHDSVYPAPFPAEMKVYRVGDGVPKLLSWERYSGLRPLDSSEVAQLNYATWPVRVVPAFHEKQDTPSQAAQDRSSAGPPATPPTLDARRVASWLWIPVAVALLGLLLWLFLRKR